MPAKFSRLLFLFLLPLLVVFAFIEYLLAASNNIYTIKKRLIEQQADSLQVLVMGSSQTFYSLNPALFNRPALNLAAPSQPLYYDNEIILRYLPRLKNLRLVIIPVDYFSLFLGEAHVWETYRLNYYHFWKFNSPSLSNTNFEKYSLLAFFKPVTARAIILKQIHEGKLAVPFQTNGMNNNGFTGLQHKVDTGLFEKTTEEKINHWSRDIIALKDFSSNTRCLQNLVAILQKKKVKILFLSTPVIPNLYAKYDHSIIKMTAVFMTAVTASYPNACYVDFSQDLRFTIDDFIDPNHLNKQGAAKFSNIIRHDYIDKMIP